MNYLDYTGRVYRGHPGVEWSARWCLLFITGFDPRCLAEWFGIGDIVILTRNSDRLGNVMRILIIELGTNLKPRPDWDVDFFWAVTWLPDRPNKRVAGYGANPDT